MTGPDSELDQLLQLHKIETEQLVYVKLLRCQLLYAHNGSLEAQVQVQRIVAVLGTRGQDFSQELGLDSQFWDM